MAIDKPYKIGNLAYTLARQLLVKDKGGIASLPSPEQILGKVQDIFQMLKAGGFNPVSAEKSIKNVNDLKKVLTDIEMKQQVEFNLAKSKSEGLETVLEKMDKGIPLNPSDQAKAEGVEKLADDKVLDAFKGFTPKVIQGGKGKKGIEKLIKDGDVTVGTAPKTKTKDYKKIVELEEENMLADEERAKDFIDFSNRIKTMSPTDRVAERLKDLKGVDLSKLSGIEAQKIASELIGRKGPFKTISNKGAKEVLGELEGIIKRADAEPDLGTKLKNFDGDPDAMAQGGRIGFSGGGAGFAGDPMEGDQYTMSQPQQGPMGPVFETNDPGAAAKEVMTRMAGSGLTNIPIGGGLGFDVGFGSQRPMDVGFSFNPQNPNFDFKGGLSTLDGKPSLGFQFRKQFKEGSKPPNPGRRNFMKLMAGLASIPVVGKFLKPAAKVKEAVPVVAEGAKLGFDNFMLLVDKIKRLGKDVTRKNATQEREKVTSYQTKDNEYELIEDLSSGDIRIVKDRMGGVNYSDESFDVITDRSVLDYKTPKSYYNNQKKKGGKTPAEYEEVKEVANRDGTFDDYDEIDDQAVQEMLEEIGKTPIKKAGGGLAYMLGE